MADEIEVRRRATLEIWGSDFSGELGPCTTETLRFFLRRFFLSLGGFGCSSGLTVDIAGTDTARLKGERRFDLLAIFLLSSSSELVSEETDNLLFF